MGERGDDRTEGDHRGGPAAPGPSELATAARAVMVDRLRQAGTVRSPMVAEAMAAVPRHRFVDDLDLDLDTAYADDAIVVKRDEDGAAISSASQPTMVAAMLELSLLEVGQRVLEVGTGTGYNAALLATIVGADGRVVSIELDDDLADAARRRLADLGLGRVEVVIGDGTEGHRPAAPFDRIIVTAGAAAVAPAWTEQLVIGGRLVVPLVGADGIGVVSCQVKGPAGLDEIATLPCGFVRLRSGSPPGPKSG